MEVAHPQSGSSSTRFLIRLEIGNVGFWGEGKTGVAGEKPVVAKEKPATNSTHKWRRHRDLNPGHIGGRRALSPLRHPLLLHFPLIYPTLQETNMLCIITYNYLQSDDRCNMTYTHFKNKWCIVYPQTLPDTETSTFIQTPWLKTGDESLFPFDLSGWIHKFKIKSWESRLTWAVCPICAQLFVRNIWAKSSYKKHSWAYSLQTFKWEFLQYYSLYQSSNFRGYLYCHAPADVIIIAWLENQKALYVNEAKNANKDLLTHISPGIVFQPNPSFREQASDTLHLSEFWCSTSGRACFSS